MTFEFTGQLPLTCCIEQALSSNVIDLDKVKETKYTVESSYWLKHNGYQLPMSDKHILLDTDAWLSDSIIAAAQVLLKENAVTNIEELQPPCLGQTCAFDVQRNEFVQIYIMEVVIGLQ